MGYSGKIGKSEEGQFSSGKAKTVEQADGIIGMGELKPPTPLQETLYDAAKETIKNAVDQAREFHKTMLSLTATFATLMASTFAILVLGKVNQPLNTLQRGYLIFPVFLMLSSSICFALGYYYHPKVLHPTMEIKLQDLADIQQKRSEILKVRGILALIGVLLFILAIISLLGEVVFFNL